MKKRLHELLKSYYLVYKINLYLVYKIAFTIIGGIFYILQILYANHGMILTFYAQYWLLVLTM